MKHSPHLFRTTSPVACGLAAAALFLCLVGLVSAATQIAIVGTLVCFLAAYLVLEIHGDQQRRRRWEEILEALPMHVSFAAQPRFYEAYTQITASLSRIAEHSDSLFRDLSLKQIEGFAADLAKLGRGQVEFHATETWRTAYQYILETLRVKTYYSVAWVRTSDYWNDAPGRQSLHVNYDLIARGFRIERVHILADDVWPIEAKLPVAGMLDWLVEQQSRGVQVALVRESDLVNETDLLQDFAVYGDRAAGMQELDGNARTQRFVLSFDAASIRQALERWERLKLFTVSFGDLMNHLG